MQLAPDDAWKCPHCKQLQQGMVQMSLWTLPDILILHLKRFRQVGERRNKLSTLVRFPLTALDMAPHMVKRSNCTRLPSAWKQQLHQRTETGQHPEDFLYDLYAVCNHHGGMHGGHYTGLWTDKSPGIKSVYTVYGELPSTFIRKCLCWEMWICGNWVRVCQQAKVYAWEYTAGNLSLSVVSAYCRNSVDGQWYGYDDSSVELVPEGEVCTREAYILFYQRRNSIPAWSASCSLRGQTSSPSSLYCRKIRSFKSMVAVFVFLFFRLVLWPQMSLIIQAHQRINWWLKKLLVEYAQAHVTICLNSTQFWWIRIDVFYGNWRVWQWISYTKLDLSTVMIDTSVGVEHTIENDISLEAKCDIVWVSSSELLSLNMKNKT